MIKSKYKRLNVSVFILLVLFPAVLLPIATKTAEAAVPTFEMNPAIVKPTNISSLKNIITALQTGLTAGNTYTQLAQMFLEWAFKLAVESLKRQLLNMIVDQIVQWIQGGGKPKFITDWPGFFRDAVDQASGRFIQKLGLGLFCSPFNLTLRAAFIPIPQFSDRSACTLSQIGVNIDNFLANFNNGGWVAWNEMVLKPQNNIYGAYLMAWDEYEREKSAAEKAAAAEAQAGRGVLSVKKCIRQHEEPQYDEDGNPLAPNIVCDEYQINTPGSVVGDLAAKAIGSDIDFIVNSQDLAAYVAAISNAILNRMFAEGVGLLHAAVSGGGGSGSGGGSSGGGGASVAQNQCAPFLGTPAYTQCVNSIQSGQNITEFQKNYLIRTIDQDLAYQNQLLGAKQTTLIILNLSSDILRQLDICRSSLSQNPSPDTTIVQSDIATITGQIAAIQSDIIALQLKQQQIRSVVDTTQISSLYAQVAALVNPAATQSLAMAAQEETSQKQTASLSYQQQLDSCLAEQERRRLEEERQRLEEERLRQLQTQPQ